MPRREASAPPENAEIGLFTSLPILWRESGGLADLLEPGGEPHWALAVLERYGRLRPLDTLAPSGGRLPLDGHAVLVLAQPRPLSPRENVALDRWVREGGRVLLFADPMLTGPSAYPLGDPRRPQDVVLISPILKRWGLELRFDETQRAGEHMAHARGESLPVNLPGSFALTPGARRCVLEAEGLLARCRIGAGRVVALADAALLEEAPPSRRAARARAFERMLALAGR